MSQTGPTAGHPDQAPQIEVLSFGEALVDFVPEQTGVKLRHVARFTKCQGGAPANLALGIAKLGGRSALMCKVGMDEFGHFLRSSLQDAGVDVSGLVQGAGARTGITFVEIDERGERSFLFYRHPSADMTIEAHEVDLAVVARSRIVHSGTNLMTWPSSRLANLKVLEEARRLRRLVSLDANIRLHQWPDPAKALEEVLYLLTLSDLFKANDEELDLICGTTDGRKAFDEVLAPRGVSALLQTHGEHGSTVFTARLTHHEPAPPVHAVDTTGAGDAFLAGLLRGLSLQLQAWPTEALVEGLRSLQPHDWSAALRLGNLTGSAVCACFGATTGMPSRADVPWEALGFSS